MWRSCLELNIDSQNTTRCICLRASSQELRIKSIECVKADTTYDKTSSSDTSSNELSGTEDSSSNSDISNTARLVAGEVLAGVAEHGTAHQETAVLSRSLETGH